MGEQPTKALYANEVLAISPPPSLSLATVSQQFDGIWTSNAITIIALWERVGPAVYINFIGYSYSCCCHSFMLILFHFFCFTHLMLSLGLEIMGRCERDRRKNGKNCFVLSLAVCLFFRFFFFFLFIHVFNLQAKTFVCTHHGNVFFFIYFMNHFSLSLSLSLQYLSVVWWWWWWYYERLLVVCKQWIHPWIYWHYIILKPIQSLVKFAVAAGVRVGSEGGVHGFLMRSILCQAF